MILLPLLGITWVFGILAVNQESSVFAWIFTILNSLQVKNWLYIANYNATYFIGNVYSFFPCDKKRKGLILTSYVDSNLMCVYFLDLAENFIMLEGR